ncbi:MAG: CPBP family intramembrane metalloprotease [candidate division WOR-3 bacterium]|nr:MAG: CPBP family intramembrane metalloprotease [candidate division WOR-3 bacterium]
MSKRQRITVFAPIAVIFSMYIVYRQLAQPYGNQFAWYAGFWVYWISWGAIFSFTIVGKKKIFRLIRPRKPDKSTLPFVAFPLIMTVIFRFLTGTQYAKPTTLWTVLLVSTAFGNGFFEEILWRGVYLNFFPKNIFYRMVWPTFWFTLWHYIPGSLSPNSHVIGLMIGSGLFGFYLAFLAKKTETVWWCIVCHTLGGILMVA